MAKAKFKRLSDEFLISQTQGKKLEAEATAFLRKYGFGKYGNKLTGKAKSQLGLSAL